MGEERREAPGGTIDWASGAGNAWVEIQDLTDRVYAGVEQRLTDEVAEGPGKRVLDVGCGTGVTTVAIAQRLGPESACTGVDVSDVMVEAARRRAGAAGVSARFELGDAGSREFEEGQFDCVVSRWGVMFFPDPVAAFSNLRKAAAGGRLRAVTWRTQLENPFMTVAEEAAAPLLEGFDVRPVDEAPGQFGLADEETTTGILDAAGWTDVEMVSFDVICSFPESELVRYFGGLGPLARYLDGIPESDVPDNLVETVREAFTPYIDGGEVRFNAACWMIRAAAPVGD
ncbi:MAG: class I SAM-dependent methyltransferase [Solirubrobacterales bacterium]|nr:class I SAM-dependent methyltransferase [Solirubrobacterales bacterium]